MSNKTARLQSSALLAIIGSIILFIIASINIAGNASAGSILAAGGVLMLAIGITQSFSMPTLMRRIGLGSVIFGTTFWGIGWIMMLMLVTNFGWWVFIVGWTLLSLGLISYGTSDIQKRHLPSWTGYLLLVGILPVLIQIAVPYHFATAVIPISQLLIMFAYSFGWVLLGHSLSASSQTQEKQLFKTQEAIVQQSSASA